MAGPKSAYSKASWKNPGTHYIEGSFAVNGASAPTTVNGKGFTVSAPSTGVYTITLADGKMAAAYSADCHLESRTTNSSKRAEIRSLAGLTSGTFTVATQSAAGTDANLSGSEVVHFKVAVRGTSLT